MASLLLLILTVFFMVPARSLAETSGNDVHLKADRLEYQKEQDLFLAEGAVDIRQGLIEIETDSLQLDNTIGKLRALGKVRFSDGENIAQAQEAEFDIRTQLGVLHHARLFIKSDHYYLQGRRIERTLLDRYELNDGSFTACQCEKNPDWKIQTRHLSVSLEKYLVAKDVVFYVKNVPIFYLPYFIYPIKTKRQTGFLVPNVGYSSRYGFRYHQDFFWAITPHQDLNFSLNHKGSKGDGLTLEYRYISSSTSHGNLHADYFFDRENKVDRWEIEYDFQHRINERIEAKLNARYINQSDHFQDLSDKTSERALQDLESNFILSYRGENSYAYVLNRYTQNLSSSSNSTTLQRLPEIGYSLNELRLGTAPIFLNFESTAVNFWRKVGLKAKRLDVYPSVSIPISTPYRGTLTPWAGIRNTWYSRGSVNEHSLSRVIYPIGIKLAYLFYRQGKRLTHMIAPEIFYEYIEIEDKDDIPQFDEVDGISNRNAVTISISQRFLRGNEDGQPMEIGSLRLTNTYRIDTARSGLPDSRPHSDLHGEMMFKPFPSVSLSIDSFYNLYDSHLSSINSDLHFELKPYVNLVLGRRSTHAGSVPQKGDLFNPLYLGNTENVSSKISFWTGSILVRSPLGFGVGNRTYFDGDKKEFVEVDYEVFYEAECWGVVLTYLDFKDRDEFSFAFTLKGLGRMKSRLFNNFY